MSKYKKKKGKQGSKPASPFKTRSATKSYPCVCHGVPAIKPALNAHKDWRDAKPTDFGGLGKFRCSVTKQRCSVRATKQTTEAVA